jgi:hypothetical protein
MCTHKLPSNYHLFTLRTESQFHFTNPCQNLLHLAYLYVFRKGWQQKKGVNKKRVSHQYIRTHCHINIYIISKKQEAFFPFRFPFIFCKKYISCARIKRTTNKQTQTQQIAYFQVQTHGRLNIKQWLVKYSNIQTHIFNTRTTKQKPLHVHVAALHTSQIISLTVVQKSSHLLLKKSVTVTKSGWNWTHNSFSSLCVFVCMRECVHICAFFNLILI